MSHALLRWPGGVLLACLLAGAASARGPQDPAAVRAHRQDHAPGSDAGCRTCHPGAVRALARGPHAPLLVRADLEPRACTACHGDQTAHAESWRRPAERQPVRAAAVTAAACANCHPGQDLAVSRGAHGGGTIAPLGAPSAADQGADDQILAAVEAEERSSGFRWDGLLEFGYRIVHVSGSRDRYATDVDLDPGPVLRNGEANLRGGGDAVADLVQVTARDLGNPSWDLRGVAERARSYRLDGGYGEDHLHYRASGDYHRVDRHVSAGDADLGIDVARDLRLFANFASRRDEGFWLTQRIGNQNVVPQTVVDGVESPRRHRSDAVEAGLNGVLAEWRFTAAFLFLDEQGRDQWLFSRPAPANPLFVESEDFTSSGSLRGPGAKLALARDLGPLRLDLRTRWQDLERRITGTGTAQGYDLAQFTTTTSAAGSGSARTFVGDLDAELELSDELALVSDLHYRDHEETLSLLQTDVTTYPTLGTSTTVTTAANPRTADQVLDGAVAIEWSPDRAVDLRLGYGFARERLRVPDLQAGDGDYLSGTLRDDGILAAATVRPDEHWTLKAGMRDFGQDGVTLHELSEDRARTFDASIGWKDDRFWATAFGKHRRAENDVSGFHLDSTATGLTLGATRGDLDLSGSYVFARTESRTLTNFYYDPDPNPVPTLVGFDGDTHTLAASILSRPSEGVRCELAVAWSSTTGSFDVALLDWHVDLRWAVTAHGAAGVEFRQIRYDEDQGLDDYGAEIVFLYWRQTW